MSRPRLKKFLLWGSASLLLLVLLLGVTFYFLAGTQKGTEWLFTRLGALMPGKLEVAKMTGPLRGPLDIRGLKYEREGFEMQVDHVQLEWKLREVFDRQLDIHQLYADGVRIVTTPSEEEKEKGPLPDVNLRFNIIVRDARVTDLRMSSKNAAPGEQPFVIDRIDLETTAIQNEDVQVDRLTVRSPTLDADVTGKVRPQGDYPVNLDVRWTYRAPDMAPFSGGGRVTGTLKDLQVDQTLSTPFQADVNALLHEPLYELSFDSRVRFSGLNPRLIRADLPELPASGEITAKGTFEELKSLGTVRGVVEQVGQVQAFYRLERAGETWKIETARIELPGTPTRLTANGTVKLGEKGKMDLDGRAEWQNVSWPLRGAKPGAEPILASRRGSARITGDLEKYRAEVQADLSGGSMPPGRWTLAGEGTKERFAFESLQANILSGRITGRGDIAWKPAIRWNAALRGDGLDPRSFSDQFPGSVSFVANSRGRMSDAGPVGQVQVSSLSGNLRGQPLRATGSVRLAGARHHIDRLDLAWSNATAQASGWVGDSLDLAWSLDAPNLGVAIPQGGGALVAQGRVSGPARAPRIQATAQGRGLTSGANSVAEADLTADVSFAQAGNVVLDLRSSGILAGERRIEELTVKGNGRRGDHQIALSAVNKEGRVDLALAGGLASTTSWRGQIRQLDLRAERTGNWSLERPAALAASTAAVGLDGFCWRSGGAVLCADGGWVKASGAWNVDSTIADFPLNTFRPFLPTDLEVTGDLDGKVRAQGRGSVLASADVDLRPGPGELRFPGAEGRTMAFRYADGVIQARAGAGGSGVATANLALVGVGSMSARVNLPRFAPGTALTSQPLGGRIDVDLNNLAFLEGFVPDIDKPGGTLAGGYQLSGTIGNPRFVGRAQIRDGRADVPRLGLELRSLQLAAIGDGSGALTLDGSVKSGKGTLNLKGRAGVPSPETPIRLAITGRDVQAMDTEEIKLVVSPDLDFSYEGQLAKLTGDVAVPSADIEMKEREEGPVKTSKDVVFVNAAQDAAPDKSLGLSARVRVVLGKNVEMNVMGLKAKPTGSILVIEEPGRVTRGSGELELKEGTFKAYGQDLTIERGRIIFVGPINNPGLDVRAYRTANDGTVAGINAKGTVREPEVTVWSNPAMAQSEALSYLLLGRPLRQASPQEGDRLANAVNALGLRGGNLLAKKLAARFGLEEARLESEGGSLEQASLVVGKYLSPRLYVSYGLGLFEPVNTFRVRYLLNDKWTLQAESGEGTSADALYILERGGPKLPKPKLEPEDTGTAVAAPAKAGGGR